MSHGRTLPPRPLVISPPLLNSANPWATTLEDLRGLFQCRSTGAVTTRTALLGGFGHHPGQHRFTFFNPGTQRCEGRSGSGYNAADGNETTEELGVRDGESASLNTLGYSPIPLDDYLDFVRTLAVEGKEERKTFIISVTGTPGEVAECYRRIARLRRELRVGGSSVVDVAMEINLSCPNIPDKPPPAYNGDELATYLRSVEEAATADDGSVPWGVKTPPYTYNGQFETLVAVLRGQGGGADGYCPLSFVTATNTLGSCLVLEEATKAGDGRQRHQPKLPGLGIGGMAGAPLHALALGNVATLRRMLDAHEATRHVTVIGVGGVEDSEGFRRMISAGAGAVEVGTALGRKGLAVFGEIARGLEEGT